MTFLLFFFEENWIKSLSFNPRALPMLLFYGVLHFLTRLFDLLSGFFYRLIDFLAGFLDRALFRAAG
jgi:hypothetical protein